MKIHIIDRIIDKAKNIFIKRNRHLQPTEIIITEEQAKELQEWTDNIVRGKVNDIQN